MGVVGRWMKGWERRADAEQVRAGLLRRDDPADLRRRRRMARVAATGAISALAVGLRQVGAVRRLPEPPGGIWSSNEVVTSRPAFVLGVPDAPLGALGFSAIMVLASRLGADPPGRHPWAARLLAAAVATSALGATAYLYEMVVRQRRLCPYCLTTAGASFLLLGLLPPELVRR
jgi:uncharacterized membrane protein